MTSTTTLYRKLAKRYHPDTVADPDQKLLLECLMVEINAARDGGNIEVLAQIDRLGPVYLDIIAYQRGRSADIYAVPYKEAPGGPTASSDTRLREVLQSLRTILHPYDLAEVLANWEQYGRARKLASIVLAAGWTSAFYSGWLLLGSLSATLSAAGYKHESLPGLAVVSLRIALVFSSLRCVFPLLIAGLFVSVSLALACAVSLVSSSALGLLHPFLAYLPPLLIAPMLLVAAWRGLGSHH